MTPKPTGLRKRTQKTGGRGTVAVTRKKTGEKEVSRSQEIEDELNCANPAYVGVNQGMTRNTGDYNSVKIGVHVSLPCLPEDDDIRRAYQRASELVNEFLDEEFEAAFPEGEDDEDDD